MSQSVVVTILVTIMVAGVIARFTIGCDDE